MMASEERYDGRGLEVCKDAMWLSTAPEEWTVAAVESLDWGEWGVLLRLNKFPARFEVTLG